METVKAECVACSGTGLYRGMCEPKGVAVVCLRCDGTGCMTIRYEPFTGRKPCPDVQHVVRSAGSFIATGVGPTGKSISYEEFERRAMP